MSFTTSMIIRATAVIAGGATAVAASPAAAAIGAGVAVLGAVSLLTGTARPSTLLRIGEDSLTSAGRRAANAPRAIARRTKNAVHSAKIEYSARQVASARKKLAKQLTALASADPSTIAALQHDQALIAARVAELTGTAPAVKVAKRAAAKNSAPRAKR